VKRCLLPNSVAAHHEIMHQLSRLMQNLATIYTTELRKLAQFLFGLTNIKAHVSKVCNWITAMLLHYFNNARLRLLIKH